MNRLTLALALMPLAYSISLSPADAGHGERILYSFTGGKDGSQPFYGLVRDASGNFYGTTYQGGAKNLGVVFELTPGGKETALQSFTGKNGSGPGGDLIMDAGGALYGTTTIGGASNKGVVFALKPGGRIRVLYSFKGGNDASFPLGALVMDKNGNLYGTTQFGGGSCGCGTVYKLAPDGAETILHAFAEGKDGAYPVARLYLDKQGDLFGTTYEGGGSSNCGRYGCGAVFEIAADGTESILHAFTGGDGALPNAGVIADSNNNFYSTTYEGGGSANCTGGCGTVFELAPDGTLSMLHAFAGSDGANPPAELVRTSNGTLYGTTYAGGSANLGAVFALKANGSVTTLHSFAGGTDGASPVSDLIMDSRGELYGTTSVGGAANAGTVYAIGK
jgi:uncharacterized repeat protein (TIGR03803 family)